MVTLWPSGCDVQDVRSVRPAERAASEVKTGHTKRRGGEEMGDHSAEGDPRLYATHTH